LHYNLTPSTIIVTFSISKSKSKSENSFGRVITVVFQIIFCTKIYVNDVFFKKNYF